MPLESYQRGPLWWAKGRVEINGRPISKYIRQSTGSPTEGGAEDWIRERTNEEIRRHHVGDEIEAMTFAAAVTLYDPDPTTAHYLIPILKALGTTPCRDITAATVRDLAKKLYPKNGTDSWRRWVITPTRAVINHAHERFPKECPPIKIKGFTQEERIEQDKARGKRSRRAKKPGDWQWIIRFCEKADDRLGALALLMFTTGARIGQAVAMTPAHLSLDESKITIPGAKGHDDRELVIPDFLVAALKRVKPRTPRGWDRDDRRNLRVFGYASKDGPGAAWDTAVKAAKIERLTPHAAGRHGFGQEMRVRQGIDKKAVEAFGGWSATGDMVDKTYTHAEDHTAKIHKAQRTGLVQAQKKTGIKL